MPTTNALVLNERLHKATSDWIRHPVTTNIASGNEIVCTHLRQYDYDRDNYFQNWYVYIEDFLNTGVDRRVRAYYTANATLNVYGTALTADGSNTQNIRLSRTSFSKAQQALNDALRETYPSLHKRVVDKSLATNMHLFEYPIPASFNNGEIYEVAINVAIANTSQEWKETYRYDFGWAVINEGNTLHLNNLHTSGFEIRLSGITPLEQVNAASDAVNVSGSQLDLLVAYAKYKLYGQYVQPAASTDTERYEREEAKAYGEYKRLLPKARMTMPARPLRMGRLDA